MTQDTNSSNINEQKKSMRESLPDENMPVFVYGNIVIRDVETGNILVKKSF